MNRYLKKVNLLLKNPRLAIYKAVAILHGRLTANFDYYFLNGRSHTPQCISVKLTNACNLRCEMCGQYREGGTYYKAPADVFRERLTIGELKCLIDSVSKFKPAIYLWGGEPFLYPDFVDLIEYIKSQKMICQINTNGTLLNKYAKDLINCGLDDLIVSLDGSETIHNQIRGAGIFNLVEEGIREVNEEKKKRNSKKPIIRIRSTIANHNYPYISELVEIAKELKVQSLNFQYLWFTSSKVGTKHRYLMKKIFDCDALSWKGFVMDTSNIKCTLLSKQIEEIQRNCHDLLVTFSPGIETQEIDRYFKDLSYTFRCTRCTFPWRETVIMPNGDVATCADNYSDYIAGNIKENDFLSIWNGERYRYFRWVLKQKKVLPICSRCCGLYTSSVKFI